MTCTGSSRRKTVKRQEMKHTIYYGWWIVLANFTIVLYVAGTIFYGFTAFFEPIVAEFGWSYTQVSLASSLRGLEMGLLAPVVGFLVDRFGSRRLLFAGILVLGAGILLLGFTRSLYMLYGSFVLIGFGAGGCTSVVTLTVVANWFDKNAGRAMGLMAAGFGASGFMVPIIVWLIHLYGWRTAAILLGLGMWAIGLPAAHVVRDRPEDHGYVPDGVEPGPGSPSPSEGEGVRPALRFREVLRRRSFVFVNISEGIRLLTLTAVITHIMPYLGTMEYSRMTAGTIAASVPLLSVLGRIGLGWLGDHFEKKHVMALGFGLMGAGMLCLTRIDKAGLLYAFLFLFPVGYGGLMVLRGAFIREHYGREFFGKLIGITMGFGAAGGVVGPAAAGWVYDRTGSYGLVWLVFTGLIGISIVLSLGVESRGKSKGL